MTTKKTSLFTIFSKATSAAAGKPLTFIMAVVLIIVWAVSGPLFAFSDTWQLVINTSTSIMTFLMVFLIQNTQNRDSMAVQLKLDELISALKGARNELIDAEDMDEKDIAGKREEMISLAEEAKNKINEIEEVAGDAE